MKMAPPLRRFHTFGARARLTLPMNVLRFTLALTLVAATPIWAAPPTAPAPALPPVPAKAEAKAAIEAAAVAALEQSAAAYARRGGFSLPFSIVDRAGEAQTLSRGTLSFARPNLARLEVESQGQRALTLSDGTEIVSQIAPTVFRKLDLDAVSDESLTPLSYVAGRIPGAVAGPFSLLLDGKNLLVAQAENFASATYSPAKDADGEDLITAVTKPDADQGAVTFRLFLDSKTHLLTRASGEITREGVPYSNTTTFGALGAAPAPNNFRFALPKGAKFAPKPYDARLTVGAAPLALSGTTLAGAPFSLDAYKGKVVLLDFWATWCAPCLEELPGLKANLAKYGPQGFEIVGISLDEDAAALRQVVKERALSWPQLFDERGYEGTNAKAYGVAALPLSVLVGKDGKIAAINPRGRKLEPAIQKALAG